jgi:hypothetical protein
MSDSQVYMNIPEVRGIAKSLQTISEVLTNVARVLDVLINTLKATAFIGLVGGYAIAQFLEMIKPQIEKMAEKCAELNRDVEASVTAYENGDAEGATRFY